MPEPSRTDAMERFLQKIEARTAQVEKDLGELKQWAINNELLNRSRDRVSRDAHAELSERISKLENSTAP